MNGRLSNGCVCISTCSGFHGRSLVNGGFEKVTLSKYKGKKVVLFFYPLDFTFVCPTEITAFTDSLDEFKKRNTEVIGVSVDSHFTHQAWANTPREEGGIKGINYPLVVGSDKADRPRLRRTDGRSGHCAARALHHR